MVLLFDHAGTQMRLARYHEDQLGEVMQALEPLIGGAALEKRLGLPPRVVKDAGG